MSEGQSRPSAPRGRGSARGGRGGYSSRAGRGGRTNGDKLDTTPIEDDGEVGQLKKQYGAKMTTIKEMFPDWTDEDVVFALQETDGDLETTVERITDGSISQWGEVSKLKKDRSKSKAKEAPTSTSGNDMTSQGRVSRGGRTGLDTGRGRGRGSERSRGGRGRGSSAAHTNGSRNKENAVPSVPTTESSAWGTAATTDAPAWDAPKASGDEGWGTTAAEAASSTAAVATKAASSIIPDGVKKSWASMFAPAPTPKKAPEPVEKPTDPTKVEESANLPIIEPELPISEPVPAEPAELTTTDNAVSVEPEVAITPSKDELTENNLEQLPDTSAPAPTATAASTAASSWDPRNTPGTPYAALQQNQPQAIRPPPASGFQASALKATGASGRSSSYQRRVLDQEEAVRMPGNREVDRAAVQFGAFNLNGSGDEDVDGDREEPETRAQPPQHSPVTHPRAALPPAPQQPSTNSETFPTPKQAPGLPAATHPSAAPGLPSPQPLAGSQNSQQGPQGANQYGRYGPTGSQESQLPPKPFDAFTQQTPSTQSPFEGYPGQAAQAQAQPQPSSAFSSAPSDYSSAYYTADQRNANTFSNNYYQQQYGLQQGAQGQQEGQAPQRAYSGYGGPQADGASSQFPQSAAQQSQSRFATAGEGQTSGHNTPNPAAQNQQQGAVPGAQPQQGHPQQPQAANYPYGHPYYSSPYYAQYMNQYQQYGQGNYGAGPYGAKAGIHGQQAYPGYGMAPGGAPYEHAASPAAGGFGGSSLHGRDSALGGSLGDYGRAGSAQSSQTPQSLGSGAFSGAHDTFGRNNSYQGQNQQHFSNQQGSQPGAGDELKPFGDSKTANGPSPALAQAGRPGSATNTAPGSALPPPQSQQGGYTGYASQLQQGHGIHGSQTGSQYTGLGGAGGHQTTGQGHQNSQYGAYQGFGGNYYGNSQQRGGGWGGNYGH